MPYAPPFRGLTPDTDPSGRFGFGPYEAAPSLNAPALMPLPWNTPTGAPKPTGGGGGGSKAPGFNWKALIDELLGPLRTQFKFEGDADAKARAAGIQRGYVRFGENPDLDMAATDIGLPAEYAGDITAETRGLARQNTTSGLSILARLKEARADALRQIKNTLAARGMLRSGESGFQLARGEQEASRAQYDSRQELLDYFAGVQAAFAQAERDRARMLATQGLGLFGQIPWGGGDGGGGDGGGGPSGPVGPPVGPPVSGEGSYTPPAPPIIGPANPDPGWSKPKPKEKTLAQIRLAAGRM